jgi:hypothetical protein
LRPLSIARRVPVAATITVTMFGFNPQHPDAATCSASSRAMPSAFLLLRHLS